VSPTAESVTVPVGLGLVASGEDVAGPVALDVPPPGGPFDEPATAGDPLGQSWARQ
jgi:hypothetical protein